MKPFKINRKSWHYKLNQHFFNMEGSSEYWMQRDWEPKHNTFCSYWRATMFRFIFASALMALFGTLFTALGVATYQDPFAALITFLSIATVFGSVIGSFAIFQYFKNRSEKNSNEPKSLFVQKYRAYKSKVCPMVEFEK